MRIYLKAVTRTEAVSGRAVEKLEKYVDDGGQLLVFLGDKVNATWYNDRLAGASRRNGGLLPARRLAQSPSAGSKLDHRVDRRAGEP